MAVTILIKRKVTTSAEAGLDFLLRKLRSLTVNQKGYLSGQSFRRVDQGEESLVISNWQSLGDWERWTASPERVELQNEIDLLVGDPTQYEIYESV